MTKKLFRALFALMLVCVLVLALASCDMLPEGIRDTIDGILGKKECAHEEVKWVVDTPANCKFDGIQHSECTECGATVESGVVLPKGDDLHVLEDWSVDITPNCVREGTRSKRCSVCKRKIVEETMPKLTTHEYFNGKCSICKVDQPVSSGLAFTSNGGGTCTLTGMGSCTDVSLIIPETSPAGETVTAIAAGAFKNRTDIKSIYIPATVTSIGDEAFKGSAATHVTVPAPVVAAFKATSVTDLVVIGTGIIPYGAMQGTTTLRNLKMEEGVAEIGENAFSGTGLKSISMPASLTKIGPGAFSNCGSLNNLVVGEGVVEIGERAFHNCDYLYTVHISASVVKIGLKAFWQSPRINKAVFAVTEGWTQAGALKDVTDTGAAANLLKSTDSGEIVRR